MRARAQCSCVDGITGWRWSTTCPVASHRWYARHLGNNIVCAETGETGQRSVSRDPTTATETGANHSQVTRARLREGA